MAHDNYHHDYSHAHDHAGHSHAPDNFGWAFAIGAALNTAFVIAELIFGYAANSLALISDAVHNLSDVVALLLAWGAAWLSQKQPTSGIPTAIAGPRSSRRCSMQGCCWSRSAASPSRRSIAWPSRRRSRAGPSFWSRRSASLINGGTALLFMRGRHGDLNIRGAYLHMVADAGVSLGVVVARWHHHADGLAMARSRDQPRDCRRGVLSGWGLARDSVNLALDGVPRGIELAKVREYLGGLEGVAEVHDLHVWAMSTNETALTAHLVRPGGSDDAFLHQVCAELSHRFNIHHATLQVEISGDACKLAPAEMV